jgi:hypothetical protein
MVPAADAGIAIGRANAVDQDGPEVGVQIPPGAEPMPGSRFIIAYRTVFLRSVLRPLLHIRPDSPRLKCRRLHPLKLLVAIARPLPGFSFCCLFVFSFSQRVGLTSAPPWPQTLQVNLDSRSYRRTSLGRCPSFWGCLSQSGVGLQLDDGVARGRQRTQHRD